MQEGAVFCLAWACYPCRMLVAWYFWILLLITPPHIPALETPEMCRRKEKGSEAKVGLSYLQ